MPPPVPLFKLNAALTLGLAAGAASLGLWLRGRFRPFARTGIPAPVAGGLIGAVVVLGLRDRIANFEFDTVLRDLFMVAFFTSVGFNASWRALRRGGRDTAMLLALATAGAMVQNAVGVALARLLGIPPLAGVVAGAVTLAGGPATALAFGPLFERQGLAGATALGVACATFGILAAGLAAGYLGNALARRSAPPEKAVSTQNVPDVAPAACGCGLLENALLVALAMGMGSLLSAAIERTGVTLPGYIGAMIAAAALRYIDDRRGGHRARIAPHHMEAIGTVSLTLFIAMALLSLRLWELIHLAGPVLAILTIEVAFTCLLTILVWRLMGPSYEGAVMAAGWCGFMVGTTANAVAAMEEVTAQALAPAPRSFLAVPVVGAFLIDFTNALVITVSANILR
jgi:glutamate:Na+ symporter, ESS family